MDVCTSHACLAMSFNMQNKLKQLLLMSDSSLLFCLLQNAMIEGQETPLRLNFAKDKPADRPPPASTIASDALQVCKQLLYTSCLLGWLAG